MAISNENLELTYFRSTVHIIDPWLKVFRVFVVGSVIQFTLGGGSTCHFSIVTDTVVFHEAK